MNYRHVLLLQDLEADATPPIAVIRRVAPGAETLLIVAHVPEYQVGWVTGAADQEAPLLKAVLRAGAGAAARVEAKLLLRLDVEALAELARSSGIDLLALGQAARATRAVAAGVRKRLALPMLLARSEGWRDRPIEKIHCVAVGSRARRAVAGFLRDHGTRDLHATVLVPRPGASGDLPTRLDVAGIEARVTLARNGAAAGIPTDLLVLPLLPAALLSLSVWPAPLLILPPLPPPAALALSPVRRAIDVPDLIDAPGMSGARVLCTQGLGRLEPIPDQDVAVVVRGRVATVVRTRDGDAEIPAVPDADAVGLFRLSEQRGREALDAIEQTVRLIRPGTRPLVLYDAELSDADLRTLGSMVGPDGPDLLAVRMRPTRSCAAIRARLRAAGFDPAVADGSAILDEGAALDVGGDLDAVRLARVAARLRGAAGFPVAAIVHRSPHTPSTVGFAALRAEGLATTLAWPGGAGPAPGAHPGRLDATTGAPAIPGNRIEVELDNTTARRWLLEAIAGATRRIHFQVYMALDDDVGSRVEAALAAAAARGVAVRVLVDSLHGLHGSFGARNRLLERLEGRPGVELRALRPVIGPPSLEDLKQRDHRKLAVVDGAVALLGGRNLSHEYYTGFGEARLTPRSRWREVPWLDAGARVEGPAVAAVERSFLDAWTAAGGVPFTIATPPPAGPSPARVVIHRGLRDACTLEAYLALIDAARSHVCAVNGFPLMLEIQHALVRAMRRGVRVRALAGHLTPTHDGIPFSGPWSAARTAATELVHSRLDPIVAVGGEGYLFAVPRQPGWAPGLGEVHPHVHAKLLTVDGRICAVGSANLDLTAGYWEDELMLVVEDPVIASGVEARIDPLLAGSQRIDRGDPTWQGTARRREWMRRWPGVLSV